MEETFADRLNSLIKSRQTTQKAIAAYAGVRYSSISDWKKEGSYPRSDIAVKIAQALGTSVEYLVTGKDAFSADERELLADYLSLNDDGKKAALAALRGFTAAYPKKGKESASLTA
jgi:transcriptional regulator with XRE-family HTH domain